MFFGLDRGSDAPMRAGQSVSVGRRALIEVWKRQQDEGVFHVVRNLMTLRSAAAEVLDKLADYVLSHFQASHPVHLSSTISARKE